MTNHLLAFRVAMRYLWSRKSHSAVTAIAVAGVCGVAVATMATICVLSVFNGFHNAIMTRDSRIAPDYVITPANGEMIANADSLANELSGMAGVGDVTPVVYDEAVAYYGGRQLPVQILGVNPQAYRRITDIDSLTIAGYWKPQPQQIADMQEEEETSLSDLAEIEDMATADFDESALLQEETLSYEPLPQDTLPVSPILITTGTAANLGITSISDVGLMIFLPRRTGNLNFSDPATAFMADSLAVTGIVNSEQAEFDAATVIMDIEVARRLLEYDTQANSIYVNAAKGSELSALQTTLTNRLGDKYTVQNREAQQTLHFRMVSIEKWITFLLLSFILIIASFNIISTLCMLVIEKRGNIRTMINCGAARSFIAAVFFWESIIVCMGGAVAGIVAGILLCVIQMQFGLITIPSTGSAELILSSYPVDIHISDIGIVFALCMLIALVTASIAGAYSSRCARR